MTEPKRYKVSQGYDNVSRGTRSRIKEIIELVYYEVDSSMSKEEIANVVGIDKRNVHRHLKKLESNNKIESSQPDQKKFYRPSGTSSQDPLNQELSREQKNIEEKVKSSIDSLRSRLGDIREEPELEEIALDIGRSFESQSSKKDIERIAREYRWMPPKESKTEELVEFLKEVIAYKEGFEKSPFYPQPEIVDGVKLPPHQQLSQKRIEEYIEDNEAILEKIDIEEDQSDPSRQDKKRVIMPPELRILVRQSEISLQMF